MFQVFVEHTYNTRWQRTKKKNVRVCYQFFSGRKRKNVGKYLVCIHWPDEFLSTLKHFWWIKVVRRCEMTLPAQTEPEQREEPSNQKIKETKLSVKNVNERVWYKLSHKVQEKKSNEHNERAKKKKKKREWKMRCTMRWNDVYKSINIIRSHHNFTLLTFGLTSKSHFGCEPFE